MFEAGPSLASYLLVVPIYGLAVLAWLVLSFSRSPHEAGRPFFTGVMYALAAFLPANFLAWLLATPFLPAGAPPPTEISWTEVDPPASAGEMRFALVLVLWNLLVLTLALWLPFHRRPHPNPALQRTPTAGDTGSVDHAHTPQ